MAGLATITLSYLEYFVGLGGRGDSPVLVSPEVGERDSARRFQGVFVLVLALREKVCGNEDGERCHGCRNDGTIVQLRSPFCSG
jgi:hypothetical protein